MDRLCPENWPSSRDWMVKRLESGRSQNFIWEKVSEVLTHIFYLDSRVDRERWFAIVNWMQRKIIIEIAILNMFWNLKILMILIRTTQLIYPKKYIFNLLLKHYLFYLIIILNLSQKWFWKQNIWMNVNKYANRCKRLHIKCGHMWYQVDQSRNMSEIRSRDWFKVIILTRPYLDSVRLEAYLYIMKMMDFGGVLRNT